MRGASSPRIAEDVIPNATGPTWTPDAQHVVFTRNDSEAFSPICAVRVGDPGKVAVLPLGTVGHGDLDVVTRPDGSLWIAYVAQGKSIDQERSFKRLFWAKLPSLP